MGAEVEESTICQDDVLNVYDTNKQRVSLANVPQQSVNRNLVIFINSAGAARPGRARSVACGALECFVNVCE